MDKLPIRKELVFARVRKALYLQLTTVIRSLGGKLTGTRDMEQVRATAGLLAAVIDCYPQQRSGFMDRPHCVLAEIKHVTYLYQLFMIGESGDGRSTKKIRAGIKRLEFLLGNWDDLEITGDLKSGYYLGLKL